MNMRILPAFILSLLSMTAWSQSPEPKIEPGKIMDTVACRKTPKQTYALYLPRDYSGDHPIGVIFFYDPGARGVVPLGRYRELAERYHLILVSSNQSHNGPFTLPIDAEAALLPDVKERFAINSDRMFISGFSGGARASVFLTSRNPVYAGVIACGTPFNPDDRLTPKEPVPIVEIIGNQDMNFAGAFAMKSYREQIRYPQTLILFEGPHQWPPVNVYDHALYLLLCLKGLGAPDQRHNEQIFRSLVKQQLDSTDAYHAYVNMSGSSLQGVRREFLDSLETAVKSNPGFKEQQSSFPGLLREEETIRDEFYLRFALLRGATADSAFREGEWKNFIARQNRRAQAKDRQESLMGQRVLAWMRGNCFEEYSAQFRNKDYFHATLNARLMTLLENSFRNQLALARTYAAREMKREAIQSLKKSVALGLTDRRLLENDRYFQSIKEDKAFQAILLKLK